MKTIEKKFYVCEICGKTAQNPERVQACQEIHRDVATGVLEATYRKGKAYPQGILFTFEDGSKVEYVYNYSRDANGKTTTYEV